MGTRADLIEGINELLEELSTSELQDLYDEVTDEDEDEEEDSE